VALAISAIPAHAQSAPAPSTPTPSTPSTSALDALTARINDIQVARTGDTISILVKLSQQPAAATVKSTGEGLTLEVDGLNLNTLNLTPPAGSLVTRVEAASGKLTLSGVAFSNPTTVIYRNAVMIEAKLAEPVLPAATSLMGATVATKPAAAVAPQPGPTPVVVPAKTTQPAMPLTAPAAAAPAPVTQPAHPMTAAPIAPTPVALTPAPIIPHAKTEAPDALQSHPAAAAAKPVAITAAVLPAASMAGLDAARCSTAAAELAKDAWALAAMGDHALCLIDAGKLDEAKNRLDQLAAITPQDWRVALGRATLAEKSGDTTTAQAAFLSASLAAPNDTIRTAITERISATPEDKETDLQLPLPSGSASKAAAH